MERLTLSERTSKAQAVIDLIVEGKSLKSACEGQFGSVGAFYSVISSVRELAAAYARAQEIRADLMADEIIQIADTELDAQVARNRIDARKWLASKMMPARYGDRIDLSITQTVSVAEALSAARARISLPVHDQPPTLDAEIIDPLGLIIARPTDKESVDPDAEIFQ